MVLPIAAPNVLTALLRGYSPVYLRLSPSSSLPTLSTCADAGEGDGEEEAEAAEEGGER